VYAGGRPVVDVWGGLADREANRPPMPWVGPGSFGHPGSGGSVGFADPDAGVGFGYVMNLWSFRIGEPRASNLAAAVMACLG
jgi:CubicO group peptidase (beta-lactamase class C family)